MLQSHLKAIQCKRAAPIYHLPEEKCSSAIRKLGCSPGIRTGFPASLFSLPDCVPAFPDPAAPPAEFSAGLAKVASICTYVHVSIQSEILQIDRNVWSSFLQICRLVESPRLHPLYHGTVVQIRSSQREKLPSGVGKTCSRSCTRRQRQRKKACSLQGKDRERSHVFRSKSKSSRSRAAKANTSSRASIWAGCT